MRAAGILLFPIAGLALAACSQQDSAENADDFANRIGAQENAVTAPSQEQVQTQASMPNAPVAQIPAGAQATQLERLGDIANVDLGARTGGCTFQEVGREVFVTAGNPSTGRGVIRVGGELVTVEANGGLNAIRSGTTFSAAGVSISVAPAAGDQARRPANMVVTDANNVTQSYSGDWICG